MGNLQKYQHADPHGNVCCTWDWPTALTMCDHESNNSVNFCTARYVYWLPHLAFVSKQLIGEVTIYMLQTTEWFEFLYKGNKPFRIVPWFTQFLSTFHQNEAFSAIRQINFPNAHRYNECRVGKVIDDKNPDVQLMLRCTKLETMAMTFDWGRLMDQNPKSYYSMGPHKLDDFLDFYQLRPMLEHKHVKKVYLVGVYPSGGEGKSLHCLERFAKWIVKGFWEGQGLVVDVYMHKRCTSFAGRVVGTKMVFEEARGHS